MLENLNIPGHLSKALKNIQNAKEKAAENKMLLDTGENLVMYLASFVLGEYRKFELEDIKFEKSFYANRANLSFGIYLGFIREGMKVIQKEKKNGLLEPYLVKNEVYEDISKFIHSFDILKKFVNNGGTSGFADELAKNQKQNYGKTNILEFFNTFIELRNRTAHPHKEIMDKQSGISKTVTWPFSDEYFDYINPYTKVALNQVVATLAPVWEYVNYSIEAREEQNYTLKSFEDETLLIAEIGFDYPIGATVLIDNNNNFYQCNDLRTLMQVGPNVIAAIEAEETEKRKIADLEGLKDNIKMALDDGQISVEEFKTFQTIARNKFEMDEAKLKEFIIKIANELGIEDPFPEIDKRFIASIDNALITKDFNRLILKLQAEQYGVNSEDFEKLLQDRADELKVDLEDVEKNAKTIVTPEDLKDMSTLIQTNTWLRDLSLFNSRIKEGSLFDVTPGENLIKGTPNFYQFNLFNKMKDIIERRVIKYSENSNLKWKVSSNRWQAGKMTSYSWIIIAPDNKTIGNGLALAFFNNGNSQAAFSPKFEELQKNQYCSLIITSFLKLLKNTLIQYKPEFLNYKDFQFSTNGRFYSIEIVYKNIDNFFKFHVDMIRELYGGCDIGFFDNSEFWNNPLLPFKRFEVIFNLLNKIIQNTVEEVLISVDVFKNPIEINSILITKTLNQINQYLSIKSNMKFTQFRETNVNENFDYIKQKKSGYELSLISGIWLGLEPNQIEFGIRIRLILPINFSKQIYTNNYEIDYKVSINNIFKKYYNESKNKENIYYEEDFFAINFTLNVDSEFKINETELENATQQLMQMMDEFIDLANSEKVNILGLKN